MANQHGLDVHYFKKNLEKILLEIDCYTPEEMQTALHRLSRVTSDAKAEILQKCANCGKEKSAKELSVCMDYRQMHRYVCDSKCMAQFYK